jgi:hypothetical protein
MRIAVKEAVVFCAIIVCLSTGQRSSDAQVTPTVKNYFVNAQLPWHKAVLDSQGRLLAWYQPEKNLGYDEYLRLDWDFLEHKVPIDEVTGVKVYLTASMFKGTSLQGSNLQHNPASTFAHQMDALLGWYPYSGDREAIEILRGMLDYQLAHGTTPGDWDWAQVPFATACLHDKEYGRCLRDMPKTFYGGIETDKIGELGLSYVQFYEMTGDHKYLDAGIACARQLAKHVRPGDAYHTPWPFRVDARSGAVLAGEEYGGMIVAPVRLFDELIRIGEGDAPSYKMARDTAWKWILAFPLNKVSAAWDKWTGYYEDVLKDTVNVNDMTSMMTAYYILNRDEPASVDPGWREHVGYLLDRSRKLLGRGPFFGAWAIDEQLRPDGGLGDPYLVEQIIRDMRDPQHPSDGLVDDAAAAALDYSQTRGEGALLGTFGRGCCSRAGLSCRTSQWGAINAMYYEKTHDGQAEEDAFRSLNYATYFAESDGKINCCGGDPHPESYWFEDGYGDAGRNFMWAMGAVPEFAPVGQNHLLRSTSVVQKVAYGSKGVEYQTFDKAGTEVLRLTFRPDSVMAGGTRLGVQEVLRNDAYTVGELPGGDYEVHVRHVGSNQISIRFSVKGK